MPQPFTRWEYLMTQPCETIHTKDLNEIGSQGWELVSVIVSAGDFTMVWKRQLPKEDER